MRNKVFIFIESFGVGVLFMVLLGLINVPWKTVLNISSGMSIILQVAAVVLISLSFLNIFLKWFRLKGNSGITLLSYGLFIVGSLIFIINPLFFRNALALQYEGFWILVSYYSLPAILVEGALFNFFEDFSKKGTFHSSREKSIFIAGMVLYMITAVGINFLTINHITSTTQHIWFSRTIIVFVAVILATLHLRKEGTRRI